MDYKIELIDMHLYRKKSNKNFYNVYNEEKNYLKIFISVIKFYLAI